MSEAGGEASGKRVIAEEAWGESGRRDLEALEGARMLAVRAEAKIVSRVLRPYFGKGTKAIEIGSGLGFFRGELFKSQEGEWTQVEPSETYHERARERSPNDRVVSGSAYNIPEPDQSVDLVVSLAAFDVLRDLDKAALEVVRVLKPGGAFVHFLDIGPNWTKLRALLFEQAGTVENGKYMKFSFSDDPQGSRRQGFLRVGRARTPEQQALRSRLVFKGFGLSEEVDIEATFQKWLVEALQKQGLKIVYAGSERGAYVGPRSKTQEQFRDVHHFNNMIGAFYMREPALPPIGPLKPEYVTEDAEMLVVVAEKPRV